MRELTFYRQKRHDGGVRAGIELDGEHTLLISFSDGQSELQDGPMSSALLWFLDLRCHGEDLPTEAEPGRAWFLDHAEGIRDGLTRLADSIGIGLDDAEPIRWREFSGFPADVRVEAVFSAIRRITGEEMATIILDHAEHFARYVAGLAVAEPAIP